MSINNYYTLFYRIFSTCCALVGVVFFGWSIFPIILLFWAENFIQIIFMGISAYSTPFTEIDSKNTEETSISQILFGKFFVNVVYLIFTCLGFVFLVISVKKEEGFKYFMDIIHLSIGKNTSFNTAILACLGRELWIYVRDFWIKKAYNAKNHYIMGGTFGYKELILHISILLGLGVSFGLSKWVNENFGEGQIAYFLAKYGFIMLFLGVKLAFEIYLFYYDKKTFERYFDREEEGN